MPIRSEWRSCQAGSQVWSCRVAGKSFGGEDARANSSRSRSVINRDKHHQSGQDHI